MTSSPKIQRLVTPLRLQRRRHLLALKKRRLDHQKEQKAEYEYVIYLFLSRPLTSMSCFSSPLQCPHRQARCREKSQDRRHQSIAPQEFVIHVPYDLSFRKRYSLQNILRGLVLAGLLALLIKSFYSPSIQLSKLHDLYAN